MGTTTFAQFSSSLSPPRFEIVVAPEMTERRVVELSNGNTRAAKYRVYTSEWDLDASGNLSYSEALRSDSCRPWVAIERERFVLPAGGKIRFRFEVKPPADVPFRECRFALFFEGDDDNLDPKAPIATNGRMGVIVYLHTPGLTIEAQALSSSVIEADGRKIPALDLKNIGTATLRVGGFLSGRDAVGKKIFFSPSGMPLLPGQTRTISMVPVDPLRDAKTNSIDSMKADLTWQWPLEIQGDLMLSDTAKASMQVKFTVLGP